MATRIEDLRNNHLERMKKKGCNKKDHVYPQVIPKYGVFLYTVYCKNCGERLDFTVNPIKKYKGRKINFVKF